VGCRVDLQGAVRARCCDRPVDLLRGGVTAAVEAGAARRRAARRDRSGARDELRRLWATQGLVGAQPRRHPGRPLHHRAAHARSRHGRRPPREACDHHTPSVDDHGTAGGPGPASVPTTGTEPVVGCRLHLRLDLVGDGLRRVRDRCLRPPHSRLARLDLDAHRLGARHDRAGDLDPAAGGCHRPRRADASPRQRVNRPRSPSPSASPPPASTSRSGRSATRWTTPWPSR